MKTAIILGTRPEIIKCSPLIRECEKRSLSFFILHTGQHYSYNMDRVFFEQLQLPSAKYNLDVGSGPHGKQTGKMLEGVEQILLEERPDIVLVQGDTNTVLAGAIAATKLGIKVAHVEAGLRSFDKGMPEEINRILADHCSDFLFAPTDGAKTLLLREGIDKNVYVVGNTVVDAVHQNLFFAEKTRTLENLSLHPHEYILATSHRQENVDNKKRFQGIMKGLQLVQREFDVPLIYTIHPRAKRQLETFNIDASGVTLVEPLDYLAFLQMESNAKLVLTDSGGVQEETCILGVPCVTLRDNTERPETTEVGSNMLAGTDPKRILAFSKKMTCNKGKWANPFGDGKTAPRILDILFKGFAMKQES
jgi:UDP-N-acetylglucosamine 2-epimerase (non-hydrolysing)